MKAKQNNPISFLSLCAGCVILNLLLNTGVDRLHLPVCLDTIGTVFSSCLGGFLPGVLVALITNLFRGIFLDTNYIFYSLVHVFIALCSVWFFRKKWNKNFIFVILYIVVLTLISSSFETFFISFLNGFKTSESSTVLFDQRSLFESRSLIHLLDKAITVAAVLLVLPLIPDSLKSKLHFTGWKQTPLPDSMKITIKKTDRRTISLQAKIVVVLSFAAILIVGIVSGISLMLFRNYTRNEHMKLAQGTAKLAADVVDSNHIDDFLAEGENAAGYQETEKLLYQIKASSPDIEYLYVYKIEEDGCHVVFDLDTEDSMGSNPGDVIPFDDAFLEYLPALKKGEEIDPIISNERFGWLLTVYKPVYDKNGTCVCYAAADVSMNDLRHYEKDFLFKLIILFLAFFILLLILGLWLAKYNIVYPINAIAFSSSAFAYNSDEARSKNIEELKNLNIHTGDEVENLYHSILKTTQDSMNYLSALQHKADTISRLQSSLIMVLADMVENRDQHTGDHIRKTAAYTQIIMEKMREKGYYSNVLTDDYIANVVQSAPLHDIGKIQIPDAILNKPGKLTYEEFEIMKTHTTAGEKIIAQAIETMPEADYLEEAKNLAGCHHEKWNGKGYPYGLAGEDIPLSARIMAVADVFDALVSRRCYKEPFSFEKAMSIIEEDTGTHFDPKVADAFLSARDEVRKVAERFESNFA